MFLVGSRYKLAGGLLDEFNRFGRMDRTGRSDVTGRSDKTGKSDGRSLRSLMVDRRLGNEELFILLIPVITELCLLQHCRDWY